jgi:hypothetical protein
VSFTACQFKANGQAVGIDARTDFGRLGALGYLNQLAADAQIDPQV